MPRRQVPPVNIDERTVFGEPPHIDVKHLRAYDGELGKKKYPFGG